MTRTPSTPIASSAMCQPPRLTSIALNVAGRRGSSVSSAPSARPRSGSEPGHREDGRSSAQRVDRSDQSFVHSERITRRWVTPIRAARAGRRAGVVAALIRPASSRSSGAAAWYSTASRVRCMNASSREACTGVSSCRTTPCSAASSPMSSLGSPWTVTAPSAAPRTVDVGPAQRASEPGRSLACGRAAASPDARRTNSSTVVSAIRRPRPTTIR